MPLSVRIINALGSQLCWLIFAFTMVFFWIFAAHADLSFLTFRPPYEITSGTVTDSQPTAATQGGSRIFANHYTYSADGRPRTGVSYSSGFGSDRGERVAVEYSPANPDRSRIAGQRRAMFAPWIMFVAIFPAIALLVLLATMKLGRQRNEMLARGTLTHGVFKDRAGTNVYVNRRRVFDLIFEFTARDGSKRTATRRTSHPERFESSAQEAILYDPDDPSRAQLVRDFSRMPPVDLDGQFLGRPSAAVMALIVPALVTVVNLYVLLRRMGIDVRAVIARLN